MTLLAKDESNHLKNAVLSCFVNIFDDLKYSVSEWRRALVVGGSCEDPRRLLMTLDDVTMVLMTDSVVVQLCFSCGGADAFARSAVVQCGGVDALVKKPR